MTKGIALVILLGWMFSSCRNELSCPKKPKLFYSYSSFRISPQKYKSEKPPIEVHSDTIKKYTKDKLGEFRAIGDTSQKRKSFIGRGQKNRWINLQDSIKVFARKVKFTIYDHALIDGDNISLFQNEKKVIQTYVKSPKTPTIVKVRISRKRPSIIEMVANNLGRIPPNTALIEIDDGNTIKKIVLNSDVSESGAFKITRSNTKIKKKPLKYQYPKLS